MLLHAPYYVTARSNGVGNPILCGKWNALSSLHNLFVWKWCDLADRRTGIV
jgi:hypothetical protein